MALRQLHSHQAFTEDLMRPLSAEYFQELLADQTPPCISLYMPTPPARPPLENIRRFDSLLDRASQQLKKVFSQHDTVSLLSKFHDLRGDDIFWRHPAASI